MPNVPQVRRQREQQSRLVVQQHIVMQEPSMGLAFMTFQAISFAFHPVGGSSVQLVIQLILMVTRVMVSASVEIMTTTSQIPGQRSYAGSVL